MFKEENETSFLEIQSFLKSNLGKNCIELYWSTVISVEKSIFYLIFEKDRTNHGCGGIVLDLLT